MNTRKARVDGASRGLNRSDLGDVYDNRPMQHSEFESAIKEHVQPGWTVLDAGAGEGGSRRLFDETDVKYLGVDSAVGDDDWDYSNVVIGDLENLDFVDDDSVDCVLLLQVLEHLRKPDRVAAELSRVLKPGGLIFLGVPMGQSLHQVPHDYLRFTPFGIRELFEPHGMELAFVRPQIYGDNQAAFWRAVWSPDYTQRSVGTSRRLIAKGIRFAFRLLIPIGRWLDTELDHHIAPVGYFSMLRKSS